MWPFSKKAAEPSLKATQASSSGGFPAEELGAEFGKVIVAYSDSNCKSVRDKFLDVLQKQIDSTRQQDEHSPIWLAHTEYEIFCERIDGLKDDLVQRILASIMHDWANVVSKFGLDDGILERNVRGRVEVQLSEAKSLGLTVFLENADVLKRADNSWRAKFPDLAAKEPLKFS